MKLTDNEVTEEEKKQSRKDTKKFSSVVFQRSQGCCEICDLYCPHILNIHHIKKVADGGYGYPDNLIALCPNCHAVIHQLTRDNDDEARLTGLGIWMLDTYGPDKHQLLIGIAYKTAKYLNDKWQTGFEDYAFYKEPADESPISEIGENDA